MGHIFISYSHKDKEYVHKLQQALQEEGFDVWVDDRIDYGARWPKVIQEQLDSCSAFILIMSENSFDSEWVQNEVARATRKGKPCFPILLSGEPWISVEATQYLDLQSQSLPLKEFYDDLAGILPRKRRQKPVAPAEIQPQQPKEAEFDVKDILVKLINKEIAGLTWTLQIQFEREVKTLFIKYYMSLGSSNREYEIFVDDRKIDYDLVPQHNNIRPGFWVDDNLSFEVIAENKKYRFNFIHKKKGHWPELKLLGYIIELKINSESVYEGESTF